MPNTNLDSFFNQFAANSQVFPALIVLCVLALPIFGYFYNKLMNRLNHEHEHTSLYVAIGVSVTLGFAALLSWKSALLLLCLLARYSATRQATCMVKVQNGLEVAA